MPLWTGQFLNSKFDSMKSKMSIKYTCLTLQSLTHREYVVYTNYMNMYISTLVISIQRHLFWKLCYFPLMQIARLKDLGVWPCHLYGHKSATLPNASMLIGTHTHIYIYEKKYHNWYRWWRIAYSAPIHYLNNCSLLSINSVEVESNYKISHMIKLIWKGHLLYIDNFVSALMFYYTGT